MVGHFEGDTLVDMELPVMAQPNPSFEDNADTDTPFLLGEHGHQS